MRHLKILVLTLNFALFNYAFANDNPEEAAAGSINPNGIFFNRFSGGFSGTEWFQTLPISGTNQYQLVDIFGGGFNATITEEGIITLDEGAGGGSFTDQDNYVIMPNLGGTNFIFTNNRVPLTNANFPLELESARPANALFSGTWNNVIESVNPETGQIGLPGSEQLELIAINDTLRITDPGGLFFQGVFENGRQIVFRRVVPDPSDSRVRSFPGSQINFSQNLIASIYFDSINQFTGIFLLQSRAPLGSQSQIMFRFTATRAVSLALGDVNGNGEINIIDRDLIVDQLGTTVESDAYNLAADLNLDDVIDNNDLALFDSGDVIFVSNFDE